MSLVSVVCYQVDVFVYLITRPWDFLLSVMCITECDREASIMMRPWPTRGCCAIGEKIVFHFFFRTGVGLISSVNQQ